MPERVVLCGAGAVEPVSFSGLMPVKDESLEPHAAQVSQCKNCQPRPPSH